MRRKHSFDIHISPSAQVPQIIEKSWKKRWMPNAIIVTTHKYGSLTHLRYHPFLEGPRSVSYSPDLSKIAGNESTWRSMSYIQLEHELVNPKNRLPKNGVLVQGSIHFSSQILHVIRMCWNSAGHSEKSWTKTNVLGLRSHAPTKKHIVGSKPFGTWAFLAFPSAFRLWIPALRGCLKKNVGSDKILRMGGLWSHGFMGH